MHKILLLCGGASAEHEISIRSAYNIYTNLDKNKYEAVIVGISRSKKFYTLTPEQLKELVDSFGCIADNTYPKANIEPSEFYACFPALHGTGGEDGMIQGYLEMLDIPYVGNGIGASAICMDKDLTKRILASHGLPVVPFMTIKKGGTVSYSQISTHLGDVLFVKAVSQGSSIGTYKTKNQQEFEQCLEEAFTYGPKVIVEQAITGREIECAVLGNDALHASCLGEVVPNHNHEYYDFLAKKDDEAKLIIDSPLDADVTNTIKELAIKAFRALDCQGLARVDFFLTPDQTIYINEINTMPGFTAFSLYPQLLMRDRFSFSNLLDQLIQLAMKE
ncbi:MAG: D-alanine--D-alanine ligase family protein [Alphaproteobacteria bacterium]|nr:D-alanine--D-alanine ligase family protein [Alphaproteobacteria bacterium]